LHALVRFENNNQQYKRILRWNNSGDILATPSSVTQFSPNVLVPVGSVCENPRVRDGSIIPIHFAKEFMLPTGIERGKTDRNYRSAVSLYGICRSQTEMMSSLTLVLLLAVLWDEPYPFPVD
jgi:hypothetical protein